MNELPPEILERIAEDLDPASVSRLGQTMFDLIFIYIITVNVEILKYVARAKTKLTDR